MYAFTQRQLDRISYVFMALLIVAPSLLGNGVAFAANMSSERLVLGTSAAGATTSHDLTFTIPTNSNIGSLRLEYCADTPFVGTSCIVPTGINTASASLGFQSGISDWSIAAGTNANNVVLSRPLSAVTTGTVVNLFLNNVVNPTDSGKSFYLRLSTFTSSDASGSFIDEGALVFSTSGRLGVGGFVPPRLTFCVGITVSDRCQSTTGSYVSLGDMSTGQTSIGTSQFAIATNSPSGYNVFIAGTTMTSGINSIPNLQSNTPSNAFASQFGINLRQNSQPVVGQGVTGAGSAAPDPNYGTANQYRYVNGERIAYSSVPSDFNRFTTSYIVNISAGQTPGIYSTTLQYIATAQF